MSMLSVSIASSNNDDNDDGNMSNSINNKGDASLIQQRLLVLLSKQYNHLQDYCNAQIALENAWHLSQQRQSKQQYKAFDLLQAVAALQKATRRVQDDFQSLETMILEFSTSPSSSSFTSTTIKDQQVQSSSSASNNIIITGTRNRQRRHANAATATAAGGCCNRHYEYQFQWQVQAEQHLQRTRRILHNLQTPNGQISTLGIPLPTGATKQEDTIVALATLRASIAQLQSVLEASKDNAAE